MDQIKTDFPVLQKVNLENARLYADRNDMVFDLGNTTSGGIVAEVGVALGDFSEFILETLSPKTFVGFDTFDLHGLDVLWGQDTKTIFGDLSHYDYYMQRFSHYGKKVIIEKGLSQDTLARYPDGYFDLIYIDAEHTYDGVRRDAELASRKLNDKGLLIFNDYIMYDHFQNTQYGVVPVVNEMVVNQGWNVVGFALQAQMFCDIAIRKISK